DPKEKRVGWVQTGNTRSYISPANDTIIEKKSIFYVYQKQKWSYDSNLTQKKKELAGSKQEIHGLISALQMTLKIGTANHLSKVK
ncbi:hypothetical protein, partial [Bacillus toyonensis]|uniref:hypothetical protein n=1 Tax=Bacillus toyonensis TaxID=155322 RepID=UPI003D65FA93